MMSEDPRKLFYSIGEVAAIFDVNESLLRFWEKEFDTIKPKKNSKGVPAPTPKRILRISVRFIFLSRKKA